MGALSLWHILILGVPALIILAVVWLVGRSSRRKAAADKTNGVQ